MKVKITGTMAGPKAIYHPGHELDVPEDEAYRLMDERMAVIADNKTTKRRRRKKHDDVQLHDQHDGGSQHNG